MRVNNLKKSYPSYKDFAQAFNPDKQSDFVSDERKSIMGEYSGLELLDKAYGDGTASKWLVPHLADLNKFSGSKNMDDHQTKALAKMISTEFHDMKISVMMMFFYCFKRGDFGKFFGKVDPMTIMCSLSDFQEIIKGKRTQFRYEDDEKRYLERKKGYEEFYPKWFSFREELSLSCDEEDGKNLFLNLQVKSYDYDNKILTLSVTAQEYSDLEGRFFDVFSKGFKKFFPDIRLQYFRLIS